MNKLMVLGVAAVAGLLFSRRKTLKDDGKRLASGAQERAAGLTGRIRGRSEDDAVADDDIIDLVEDASEQDDAALEETPASAT